jgi:MFS family permease
MAGSGLGALTGAIYLAYRRSVRGLGKVIPLCAGLFGFGLIGFSLSRLFPLSLALMVIIGFGMMMQMASSNTILQTVVEDDKRGRVMSFYTMAIMGTAPFGSLLAGKLADVLGVPDTLRIGGISCIFGALLFAGRLPEMREVVRPIYVRQGIISEDKQTSFKSRNRIL